MRAEFRHMGYVFVFEREMVSITTPKGVSRTMGAKTIPKSEYGAFAKAYVQGYQDSEDDKAYGA